MNSWTELLAVVLFVALLASLVFVYGGCVPPIYM